MSSSGEKLAAAVVVPVGGKLGEMRLVIGLCRGLLIVEELLLDLLHFGGWIDADLLCVDLVERAGRSLMMA